MSNRLLPCDKLQLFWTAWYSRWLAPLTYGRAVRFNGCLRFRRCAHERSVYLFARTVQTTLFFLLGKSWIRIFRKKPVHLESEGLAKCSTICHPLKNSFACTGTLLRMTNGNCQTGLHIISYRTKLEPHMLRLFGMRKNEKELFVWFTM